jgi:hypothetical protein
MKKKVWWKRGLAIAGLTLVSHYGHADFAVNGIDSISYEGTGCPQGSVGQSFSNDRQSMTLIFDSFVASTGPGVPESEEVKECRIDLTLQTDESVEVSMQSRGYVQLASGMTGDQHQNVPRSKRSNLVTPFSGPVAKDYVSQSTAKALVQGDPFSKTMTIILQTEVDKGKNLTSPGQLTLDSFDLQLPSDNSCSVEGAMACAGTEGFVTCDNGSLVYRNCAPGTVCVATDSSSIVCDWPSP